MSDDPIDTAALLKAEAVRYFGSETYLPSPVLALLDALAAETARAEAAEAELEHWKAKQHYEWNQGDYNTARAIEAEGQRDAALAEVERLRAFHPIDQAMMQQALTERDAAVARAETAEAKVRAVLALCDEADRQREYHRRRGVIAPSYVEGHHLRAALADGTDPKDGAGQ